MRLWLIGVFLCFLAVSCLFLPSQVHTVTFLDDGSIDFSSERDFWKKRIAQVGEGRAYAEVAAAAEGLSELQQHIVAHAFGESLYESAGWDSVSVCDTKYGQGCLHSFIGSAIDEHGISSFAPRANDMCLSSFSAASSQLSCQHAIGHGLLGHLGYTLSGLEQALAECDTLPHRTFTIGCYGGVLMEYNLPILQGTLDSKRPLSVETSFTPCIDLPSRYQKSCVFYQPFWWSGALFGGKDTASTTVVLGEYCRRAPSPVLVTTCFQGIGYMATQRANYEAEKTAQFCAAASEDSKERLACWSYALPMLRPHEARAQIHVLCTGLRNSEFADCVKHSGTAADVFNERGESHLP